MNDSIPAVLLLERAGREYAIEARYVRGVVPAPVVARVPGAPASILGLVAWRGIVLALVEPSGGREQLGSDSPNAAIIVEVSGETLAIAADTVPGFARPKTTVALLSIQELLFSIRTETRVATEPPRHADDA